MLRLKQIKVHINESEDSDLITDKNQSNFVAVLFIQSKEEVATPYRHTASLT